MRKFNFISDPGHGWLEVNVSELVEMDLCKDISGYSYLKGDKAYLEEDCDAGKYLDKLKEQGVEFEFNEVYQENTPIRNYAGFGLN